MHRDRETRYDHEGEGETKGRAEKQERVQPGECSRMSRMVSEGRGHREKAKGRGHMRRRADEH